MVAMLHFRILGTTRGQCYITVLISFLTPISLLASLEFHFCICEVCHIKLDVQGINLKRCSFQVDTIIGSFISNLSRVRLTPIVSISLPRAINVTSDLSKTRAPHLTIHLEYPIKEGGVKAMRMYTYYYICLQVEF